MTMPRPPHPDTPAAAASAASSWAAPPAGAAAAPAPGPDQLPLFQADAVAPALPRTRHARLRGRLQALLARSAAVADEAPREPRASWPDSFFDVDGPP